MPKLPGVLTDDVIDELPEEEARQERARKTRLFDQVWPKPSINDVTHLWDEQSSELAHFHSTVDEMRDVRYLKRQMTEKFRRRLKIEDQYHTRLIHNLINRVTAMQTKNPVKIRILPAGAGDAAKRRAKSRERWNNALLPAMERLADRPIRRRFVDNLVGDGLGIYEVYLTNSYDQLVEDGFFEQDEDESPREYNRRVEDALKQANLPFRIRTVDPLSYAWLPGESDGGVERVVIEEYKPVRQIMKAMIARGFDPDRIEELRRPLMSYPGSPARSPNTNDTVRTLRYYDERWYGYIVEGEEVDMVEHGLPGVPCFHGMGMVTGAPELALMMQGVGWGLEGIEAFLDDAFTWRMENQAIYGRPHPYAYTPLDPMGNLSDDEREPSALDFSDPETIMQLRPGQEIKDAFADFRPYNDERLIDVSLSLFDRSALNPIAMGEAPGADTAGYTANLLSSAATAMFEGNLDAEASTTARMVTFINEMGRDTIGQKMFLPVPGDGQRQGQMEWVGLDPDDVDGSPVHAHIDSFSDLNRLALRSSLLSALEKRLISKDRVREEGFGIEDTEAEENAIIFDDLEEITTEVLKQKYLELIGLHEQAQELQGTARSMSQGGPMPGPPGEPGAGDRGGVPAPMDEPTVGPAAGASQRPGSTNIAGQDRGRRPPNALGGNVGQG